MEDMGITSEKKILIIGNLGYIGPVAARHFRKKYGSSIYLAGFDIGYFVQNYTTKDFVGETYLNIQYYGDVRNFDFNILNGFDAVVYLAAISNDPMGNIYEKPTMEINYHCAVKIASEAKKRKVSNFVFASSCSVYGFADTSPRVEASELNPLTAYAKSKVYAEKDLAPLADENFKITCLRFATACGFSDRLRLDLVLNDFVASAITTGKITILSDGSPWRPLIHVEDMSRAIDWAIHRADDKVYLIVNAGSNEWNYQVKELAYAVQEKFDNVSVSINKDAQPDKRSYMVSFDLFSSMAQGYLPNVSLGQAIDSLKSGLQQINFSDVDFRNSDYIRLKFLQNLINRGSLNQNLERV